jgi:hypothetical protein
MTASIAGSEVLTRRFRQILLWPLQLEPLEGAARSQGHAELLRRDSSHQWREVDDEFRGAPQRLQERHYAEFVTFLPYVQRVLYGQRAIGGERGYESPLVVFARDDVASVRLSLETPGAAMTLEVSRVHLFFFSDIDVAISAVEIASDDLTLENVEGIAFEFGRAYPAFWHTDGRAGRCPSSVEWIGRSGEVLARSDYENRARFLETVAHTHAPCFSAHWEWLLRPMVPANSNEAGMLRYKQLEYYRMPAMTYLAFDDPTQLDRSDFVRLGLGGGPGEAGALPMSSRALMRFEMDYCYDKYWAPGEKHSWPNTRFICSGHTFVMIGKHGDRFFAEPETGLLAQFRRQYLLLGLIAHFHKAALLMFSDRLTVALDNLIIGDVESVKEFKREIRRTMETFLRFTHRYWFHEVSTQDQARDLFRMWCDHLGTDRLYAEVREEVQDMDQYLDSDSLRRQANTVVRLTVVTTLGLIATVATGILGMNVFDYGRAPWPVRVAAVGIAIIAAAVATFFMVFRAKRLADFLEALSDDRLRMSQKLGAWGRVWWSGRAS